MQTLYPSTTLQGNTNQWSSRCAGSRKPCSSNWHQQATAMLPANQGLHLSKDCLLRLHGAQYMVSMVTKPQATASRCNGMQLSHAQAQASKHVTNELLCHALPKRI